MSMDEIDRLKEARFEIARCGEKLAAMHFWGPVKAVLGLAESLWANSSDRAACASSNDQLQGEGQPMSPAG